VASFQKPDAIGRVEVVQEVRHEHDVVIRADVHVESAPGNRAETVGKAGGVGVCFRILVS
jgi:hypothetical protein